MSVNRSVTVPVGRSAIDLKLCGDQSAMKRVALAAAVVPGPARELAQGDHADEDEPDDQHPRDHLLPLLGGVLEERQREEQIHRGGTLADQEAVGGEGFLEGLGIGHLLGSAAQPAGGGGPRLPVVDLPLGP